MARIVQKFGGTSVADIAHIKRVAERIKSEVDRGNQVAAVVSAMAGVTNQFVSYCGQITSLYDAREYDTVVAAGEQVTCGLLAMALQSLGVPARSWLGWQIPIRTDDVHGKARIVDIETDELVGRLKTGEVPVVAGFQGVAPGLARAGRRGAREILLLLGLGALLAAAALRSIRRYDPW